MSARDDLFEYTGVDEDTVELYQAVKDEVLREAAAKIRGAHSGELPDLSWVVNASDAADLIDPDKGKS